MFFSSFISREETVVDIAEEMCFNPEQCLTTLIVDNSSEALNHLQKEKYAKYQVNTMLIPANSIQRPITISLYCPFFAIKQLIVNVWSPMTNSLLFNETSAKCGHPLRGNQF